ncbi:RCH2 [Scenedesmus sp. PABB004]|nr:RCH2 [Scenedesmus sp. PABB004]
MLCATSWAHTDQCPDLLAQLLELLEQLERLQQPAGQVLVTLTVVSIDSDAARPGAPMFLVWEEVDGGGAKLFKHLIIHPGCTVVMRAKAAFLTKHQMFALPNTVSLRLRGCWVPCPTSGASPAVRQLVDDLRACIEKALVAEAEGPTAATLSELSQQELAGLEAAFGEMLQHARGPTSTSAQQRPRVNMSDKLLIVKYFGSALASPQVMEAARAALPAASHVISRGLSAYKRTPATKSLTDHDLIDELFKSQGKHEHENDPDPTAAAEGERASAGRARRVEEVETTYARSRLAAPAAETVQQHAAAMSARQQRSGVAERLRPARRRAARLALLAVAVSALAAPSCAAGLASAPAPPLDGERRAQSIPSLPGCSRAAARGAPGAALEPELAHCAWSVQMQRHATVHYAFEVAPDAADNMSVVIMARAVAGQITMQLWGPGSDPARAVPTQTGTNYMDMPGLRELDQDASAAGGGHASLASEQTYLSLPRREGRPLAVGRYVVALTADMGQPLVTIEVRRARHGGGEAGVGGWRGAARRGTARRGGPGSQRAAPAAQVSTPSAMTQLVAEEQEALKALVAACCPGLAGSPPGADPAAAAGPSPGGWCGGVGAAVTYDLRQWHADVCHTAPNVCDRDGRLLRLILPPYALQCSAFPKALAQFTRLTHLDLSYSTTGGTLADVAAVVARMPALEQLHLRGVGLAGPLGCELVAAGTRLKALALSDNDRLAGTLPPCWFASLSLQELQLAGLSRLSGPLPDAGAGAGSASCGFGTLRSINLAGVIGDDEAGLTGPLPRSLGRCASLRYLDVSGHSLSGALPAVPAGLQYLNLSSNGLSQRLPDFSASPELQYVDLSFNRFSGSLPDLAPLTALDWLDLSVRRRQRGGPAARRRRPWCGATWFGLSSRRRAAAAQDNELSGPLPALPRVLRWVDLSNNELSGGIAPTWLGGEQEPLLVLLNLSRNKLSGPLPASLAALPALSFLDLSSNELDGKLDAFAAALGPKNQLLQLNLSHNKLSGAVPAALAALAAVRPVMVTMRDGVTPVHRILDLSHNPLTGAFPAWLIAVLPQLTASCRCSIGVSLDQGLACPPAVPALDRKAVEVLHGFEALQCTAPAAGAGGRPQQVPVWHLAGPSFNSAVSRAERRRRRAAQPAGSAAPERDRLDPAAVAALAASAVVAAALLAGAAGVALRHRQRLQRHSGSGAGLDALLHHYEPVGDAPGPPSGASGSPRSHCGSGAGSSPLSGSSSRGSGGSAFSDGLCEIALVDKRGGRGVGGGRPRAAAEAGSEDGEPLV